MNKRVVITGMGAVTPVGNNAPSFWQALLAGTCGVGPITKFDAKGYKVGLAAEVKDFHPEDSIEKSMLRKTDLFCQYAMAAAAEAMDDSGIRGKIEPERLGVFVGSGIGGMQTFIEECTKLNNLGPRRVSPFFIPKLISNIAAGNIAVAQNAQGPSMCIVTACATSRRSGRDHRRRLGSHHKRPCHRGLYQLYGADGNGGSGSRIHPVRP